MNMGKQDPESFPAGSRLDRPHAEDGWQVPRAGDEPYRPDLAQERADAYQERHRNDK